MRPGAALGVLAAALALPACSSARDPGLPPNVVLIVVDTLRADHLGCYGYARSTSPRMDAFAAGATRYARAISSGSWTVPSHASMFTGKAPFAHGAHDFPVERERNNVRRLAPEELTLAEALSEQGYRTAAFAANAAFLARHWQLDQGFERYQVERVFGDRLNPLIFRWLDGLDPAEPFFLFVNYIDTHGPFNADPRPEFDLGARADEGRLHDELALRVLPGVEPAPPDLVQRVIDQYDTAIANVDAAVGELLDRLRPLEDASVVVVTSDHGHFFGEHALAKHSKDVYQEVLAVPLLVRAPGQREGRVEERVVASSDLPRLILSHFPEPARQGLLARFPEPGAGSLALAENYYARPADLFHPVWGWRFRRVRRAVFEWPFKLIHSSDGQHELYDLAADPAEAQDLYAERPEVAARLERALAEEIGDRQGPEGEGEPAELDPELTRQLEALGYQGE